MVSLLLLSQLPGVPPASAVGEVDSFPHAEVLNEEPPHQEAPRRRGANGLRQHNVDVAMAVDPGGGPEDGGGGDVLVPAAPPPEEQPASIIALEQRRSEVEGPVRLKVDDKDGLLEEGPYRGSDRENRSAVPKICTDGVPCQRVDSRVRPSAEEKKKDGGSSHHRRHSTFG